MSTPIVDSFASRRSPRARTPQTTPGHQTRRPRPTRRRTGASSMFLTAQSKSTLAPRRSGISTLATLSRRLPGRGIQSSIAASATSWSCSTGCCRRLPECAHVRACRRQPGRDDGCLRFGRPWAQLPEPAVPAVDLRHATRLRAECGTSEPRGSCPNLVLLGDRLVHYLGGPMVRLRPRTRSIDDRPGTVVTRPLPKTDVRSPPGSRQS